ncbi:hypothetical protein M493_06330 [Geobacillus genomosp. 3]|uniref:Uncharacterized protein n=1 Tax=Geobacillus genomosp. 3 TaxID=1921421 RepID=S5Z3J2_GEOG3|nr:hypothetical protein [Geobacillus genomosp. 3]AGT31562.1 hypothetical protein M493_06330 [Geobacillus genomosp. 3]
MEIQLSALPSIMPKVPKAVNLCFGAAPAHWTGEAGGRKRKMDGVDAPPSDGKTGGNAPVLKTIFSDKGKTIDIKGS